MTEPKRPWKRLKEGTLTATVDWFPKKLVKTAISALLNHSRNGAPLESSDLKPLLVDESNLESAKLMDDADVPVATPTPAPTPTPTPTPEVSQNAPDPYVVPVFYATNRAVKIVSGVHGPGYRFTSERSPDLKFGSVVVKVPHGHRRGIVERPGLDWLFFLTLLVPKLESERPADHFILSDLRVLTEEDFVQEIGDTGTESALLYVHGFNTSFEDGIFTLAQIKFDSQYPGIAVAFSWPSGDNLFSHGYATASADFSRKPFLQVVNILKTCAHVSKIYVIAHSLGNRIVADSLDNDRQVHLAEIIMAAPDVDWDVFRTLADGVRRAANGVTLYADSSDKALFISRLLAGGPAGSTTVPGAPLPDIEIIDVTAVGDDLFGINHNMYSTAATLLGDIGRILLYGNIRLTFALLSSAESQRAAKHLFIGKSRDDAESSLEIGFENDSLGVRQLVRLSYSRKTCSTQSSYLSRSTRNPAFHRPRVNHKRSRRSQSCTRQQQGNGVADQRLPFGYRIALPLYLDASAIASTYWSSSNSPATGMTILPTP